MPLNVRRYCNSVSGVLLLSAGYTFSTLAQGPPATPPQTVQTSPTSGDIMRERIAKSKAFIAVRNYNAAIYELENIRRESSDPAVQGVVNVLLMNSYLELGDYKRAQDMLTEFYSAQKSNRPGTAVTYVAVAGQIIKSARNRAERYKALGLNIADRTLPLEALNDLDKMRETLELVIAQSKEIGADKTKAADAMAMLEEASNSRSMLARDDYDSRRWKAELADTREKMTGISSDVKSALGESGPDPNSVAATTHTKGQEPLVTIPVSMPAPPPKADPTPVVTRDREVKLPESVPGGAAIPQNERPVYIVGSAASSSVKEDPPKTTPVQEDPKPAAESQALIIDPVVESEKPKDDGPMAVGSLIPYATNQAKPVYPPAAKVIRASGIVTVEVVVDESGQVAEVQKASGPAMLQAAAKDAIKKWRFKPFTREGQPVRAIGWVNFNFAL